MATDTNPNSWQKVLVFGLGRLLLGQAARGAAADIQGIAALLAGLLTYVLPYRKRVIEKNGQLTLGLQGKDLTEFRFAFYRHFAALVAEILASFAMTSKQIADRIEADFDELINTLEGHSVGIVMPSHQGNWEWMIGGGPTLMPFHVMGVYQTLSQSFFEQVLHENRTKAGGSLVPQRQLLRALASLPKDRASIVLMMADQAPPVEAAFIYPFLQTSTGFYTGPQTIAARLKCPVYYAQVLPGLYPHSYRVQVQLLQGPQYMKQYVACMERDILAYPSTYLWSHNRFKHTYTVSQDDGGTAKP